QYFKVYNTNDRKLLINTITLSGGDASYFKINADGFTGPQVTHLEMEANDSLYVFVTVNINPSAANLPFIVEDSIKIVFNGNQKWVKLQAWGQNAHFLSSSAINTNTAWTNDKPYVITGGLLIGENATLTIQKGTKIYLHADAPVFVDGTIVAAGERYDSTKIIFSGDRLDNPYSDYPAAWPGLYFRDKSKNNMLQYVIIKNAYQGIVVQNPASNSNPKLTLNATIINNCYDAGLIGIATSIDATNCLISNCGKNILIADGGEYHFAHCTDAAYSNTLIVHKQPVLGLGNLLKVGNNIAVSDLNATFKNCIFWGDNGVVTDEVVSVKENSAAFNAAFTNCLWKVTAPPEGTTAIGMIENADPVFISIDTRKEMYDFHLQETSPAINTGAIIGVLTDLNGNARDPNFPDIGAYESAF
ncbi:MAG: choice-of-anchor Q domain-containing protein, partial [Flavitalea sp.]